MNASRQRPHLQASRCLDVAPVDARRRGPARPRWSAPSPCPRRSADAPRPRRGRAGLSNSRPSTLTTLSLPITQSSPRDAAAPWPRRARRRSRRDRLSRALTAASSTSGATASIVDARRIEHLAPDRAGGSEDQGQTNNLVEKRPDRPSPDLGTGSTGDLSDPSAATVRDFIHGDEIHPQPVNHGWESARLARFPRESPCRAACWQFREARLNPAVPRPTTSSILF